MAREVDSSISSDSIIHSQLVLPRCNVVLPEVPEDCEGLWARVNRICDRYMPQPLDMRFGAQLWWAPEENANR